VTLDGLPQGLLVLRILALEGISHQILVDEDLRVEGDLFLELLLDFDIVLLGLDPSRRHFGVSVDGLWVSMVDCGENNDRWWKSGRLQGKRALLSLVALQRVHI
jgi:hypothetical protein